MTWDASIAAIRSGTRYSISKASRRQRMERGFVSWLPASLLGRPRTVLKIDPHTCTWHCPTSMRWNDSFEVSFEKTVLIHSETSSLAAHTHAHTYSRHHLCTWNYRHFVGFQPWHFHQNGRALSWLRYGNTLRADLHISVMILLLISPSASWPMP